MEPARALAPVLPHDRRTRLERQRARFESHLAEILGSLGLDLDQPGTRDTPRRLLDALIDATSGYVDDPKLVTAFDWDEGEGLADGQVVEGPIPFTALCEHHALPFFGHAFVGYVPHARVLGLSKLTRLVRQFACRFTMQERLGVEVARTLTRIVGARGAAVRIEAAHLCTRMRGVREPEAVTATSTWLGAYRGDAALRSEFLALCRRR